jgi:hypothetical protein
MTIARVSAHTIVIPAKAGIHFRFRVKIKMDSGFRRNDGGVSANYSGAT